MSPLQESGAASLPTLDGDFKLVRRIGLGGDSEVFLAEQLSVDRRRVAVKVYRPYAGGDRRDSPFYRERKLLSVVSEDVFPVVFRSGMADKSRPYVAMEYLHGKSLGHFFERGDEAFSNVLAVRILDRLVEGLRDLHKHEIVHRDLKPDNIILVPKWQGFFRVKMIDFSHARVPFGREERGVEEDGDKTGTQFYMAPEQMNGQPTDERTDLYSLAVLFYEIITSVRAIQPQKYVRSGDFFEYMKKGFDVPTHSVGTFRPDLPAELDDVIRRGCARKPKNRYDSVVSFHQAIHHALGDRLQEVSLAVPSGKSGLFANLYSKATGRFRR